MAPESKIKTIISQNPKLASMREPFSQYYPYYTLGIKFKDFLDEFLKTEAEYVATMGIQFKNVRNTPINASSFLSSFDKKNIDSKTTENLAAFLKGVNTGKGDRSKALNFDFEKINRVRDTYYFDQPKNSISEKRIQEFWLRLQKCVKETKVRGHTDQDFMDLLSAFCGFDNFEAYLNSTFGEEYQADRDDTYQALITGSALNLSQTSSPKSFDDDPTELVAVTVDEPAPDYFFGREDDLFKITHQLSKPGILVINGEGGMGKTTVAAAYYHRSLEERRYKNMAWLFCGQGTLSSIYRLAPALGLDFRGLDEGDKLLMIQHSLKAMEKDFLLVLDNVDNDLADFLMEFQGFKWHLLITGRARLGWEAVDEYELPPLSPQAAKALFKKHYRSGSGEPFESGEEFDALLDKLISAIGYNTLLIEVFSKQLANEFYDHGANKFGIREFLDRLEQKGLYLVDAGGEIRTNYAFYRRENVATTTEILDILYDFSNLDDDLRRLLVNLALLPAESHSLKFLFELFEPQHKGAFQNHLQELFSRGWIAGDGRSRFRLSPVIQSLAIEKNRETLWEDVKGLVERVSALIKEEPEKDNLHTKHRWLPVADSLERHLGHSTELAYRVFLNDFALLLRNAGGRKNLERATQILEKALESDIKKFGENTSAVAHTRSNLAGVLKDFGGRENLQRAAGLLKKALESNIKTYGEDKHVVAVLRSNLATVFQSLGGYENLQRAAEFLEKTLESNIKNFGEEASEIAIGRSNLALVLKDLGGRKNLQRAAELMERALESDIKNFGEEASAVARSNSNLALVLKDLGGRENLQRTAKLLKKALESDIKNFGKEAPIVATGLTNHAMGLTGLHGWGNLQQAVELLKKALELNIQNFGEDAPVVAASRSTLAAGLRNIKGEKNLRQAVKLLEMALGSDIKNFGEEASNVAENRFLLALVLQDLGGRINLHKAVKLLEMALASDIKNFGEDAPVVARTRFYLAMDLKSLGGRENLERAFKLLENALSSDIKNFGKNAPIVALRLSGLSLVIQDLGGRENLKWAAQLLETALASNIKNLGENASAVGTNRFHLAMMLRSLGGRKNLHRAAKLLEMALASDIKNLGEDATTLANKRSNLALILQDLGGQENLKRAAELLEKALDSGMKNFAEDETAVATIRLNLAAVLRDLGGRENLLRAKKELALALPSAIRNFGEDHSITKAIKSYQAAVEKDLKDI